VVAELAALSLGFALAAGLPQQPEEDAVRAFASAWPWLGRLTAALGLHEVVTRWWFLGLVGLATASLVAVQLEQWRRVRRTFGGVPSRETLAAAPYRATLEPGAGAGGRAVPWQERSGRLGLLGSPVFHLGLLTLVVAGLVRVLTFGEAAARVFEREVLEAGPGSFQAARHGLLGRPFLLPVPLRLDAVVPTRYASGALERLEAKVTLLADQPRQATLAINAPLELGDARTLYLLQAHGVSAVLVERRQGGAETTRLIDLDEAGAQLRGGFRSPDGWEVRLSAAQPEEGVPDRAEVRAVRGGALLALQTVPVGGRLALDPGTSLELAGFGRWATVKANRDPSLPLFVAGVVTALLGVLLMFGVVTVDSAAWREGDRLVVAMRPHRFAPLFGDRFERLRKEWTT
jgi:hypothetical protein